MGNESFDLANKCRGPGQVQGGDSKDTFGVVDTMGLEDLGGNDDGRVDGV